MATTDKIVPLVSSGTAGPLGAIHLPRLWSKLTLHAAGKLPEDYDYCGDGFDQLTLNALGLDRQRTIDYVAKEKPTYMQFEAWILAQNGGTIDPAAIEKHNSTIRGYNHGDELASSMRDASGVKHPGISDAVTLNTLEDLDALHKTVSA